MRISRVEAIEVRVPYAEVVREALLESYRRDEMGTPHLVRWLVRLETDDGLIGVGESVLDPRPQLTALGGRAVSELVDDVSLGPACMIAVYDLAARARGVPVSRLFSESPRPAIQQAWWSRSFPPEVMRREVERALAAGYRSHKVKARPYHEPAEQAAAVAEVVPPGYRMLFDANGSFGSVARAVEVASTLTAYPFASAFEEPIPQDDLAGYRELRRSLGLALAVHWDKVDPRLYTSEALCDAYVVEDFAWGPPLVDKHRACEASGQRLWVENGLHSGISQVFQAHMAAALPSIELCISLTHMLEDDLVVEPFRVSQGWYTVPAAPGLGVTLDEDALDRYRVS